MGNSTASRLKPQQFISYLAEGNTGTKLQSEANQTEKWKKKSLDTQFHPVPPVSEPHKELR